MSNMKSINLIFLVVFITLSATTAKHLLQPRIINGQNATEGQFPHMVSLRDRFDTEPHCGASILSNRFLLTAAHCVQGRFANPKIMLAIVGTLHRTTGGVIFELDTITAHKKFNLSNQASGKYDVAVLKTATEITFTDVIQPIALPKANLPEDRSVKVVLSGWGRHKIPSFDTPDILQFSELDTINTIECAKRFGNVPDLKNAVSDGNVCTIDSKHGGACHGDSGSGLIDVSDPNHKTVVGIASWVYQCAQGYPDVFTRVYTQLDWIHEQIEKQSGDL